MITEDCSVVANIQLSKTIYCLALRTNKIASQVKPGQFVHLQLFGHGEHILRRPFSVHDVSNDRKELIIIYQTVGRGTLLLSGLKSGNYVNLLGPVGNGWQPTKDIKHALLIGGGIGAAPLNLLAKKLIKKAKLDIILGAANASMLVLVDSYANILPSSNIHICTDDGSAGVKGYTTDIAKDLLTDNSYDYIASCGPEPMQQKIAQLARDANITCELSLEKRMACGLGACLSCVISTASGQKRVCVDGPVFDAREVLL
jgi:dihydroorotate dehydrogenase electron transfer subunit